MLRRPKHPNENVNTLARKTLATLRKWQDLVDRQIQIAAASHNDAALSKLETRQHELQAAVMLKEFGEVM